MRFDPLRVQMPRRIAADVALLRTFFPDRLDLGVAGADSGDGLAEAMTGGPGADDATYQARIEELTMAGSTTACPRSTTGGARATVRRRCSPVAPLPAPSSSPRSPTRALQTRLRRDLERRADHGAAGAGSALGLEAARASDPMD